jgi:hypothetical protein
LGEIQVPPEVESLWAQLLAYIEDGRVVPIVGPGLLTASSQGTAKPYYTYLAERLAPKVGVSPENLPGTNALNEVACRHLANRGQLDDLYSQLFMVSREERPLIPEPLLQLASMPFRLFVTTTFDSLLERALNQVRFGGSAGTEVLSYSLTRVQDLKGGMAESERPLVYHLFGKLAAIPDFAVTHEDILEFVHALQSETRYPPNLYKELEDNSLLILGSGFSDWLARFFLRTPRRQRLSAGSKCPSFVADPEFAADNNLIVFLSHFSRGTRVFPAEGPAEFVAELHRRWRALHPPQAEPPESKVTVPPGRENPFVFLSYASEDRPAVDHICQALTEARVDVFFDKEGLEGGENWEAKLREKIRRCSLFMPIISRHVLTPGRRFFRREWEQALELFKESPAYFCAKDVFMLPVAIDSTPPESDRIPQGFRKPQWWRLPDGAPTPEFVERVKDLHRRCQQERAGAL